MVAKSYQSLEQVGEPYIVSGRQYVQIRLKTGALKQVRWYSVTEYNKMYPNAQIETKSSNQKSVLGFDKGYITIFKGDTYPHLEWFKQSIARYTRHWGWYIVSTEELPEDIPSDLTPIQLFWEQVSENDVLYPEEKVKQIVETLTYDADPSEYVGNIGDRIPLRLRVDRVVHTEGAYGPSNIHTMRDENDNIFVWATTAKDLTIGKWYTMTAGIKDHRVYKNAKQTWLTRCLQVKEA